VLAAQHPCVAVMAEKEKGFVRRIGKAKVGSLKSLDPPGGVRQHRFEGGPFHWRPFGFARFGMFFDEMADEVRKIPPCPGEPEDEVEHDRTDSNQLVEIREEDAGTVAPSQAEEMSEEIAIEPHAGDSEEKEEDRKNPCDSDAEMAREQGMVHLENPPGEGLARLGRPTEDPP